MQSKEGSIDHHAYTHFIINKEEGQVTQNILKEFYATSRSSQGMELKIYLDLCNATLTTTPKITDTIGWTGKNIHVAARAARTYAHFLDQVDFFFFLRLADP